MGKVCHNVSLGTGKLQIFHGTVHDIGAAPVQNANQKTVMRFQGDHLLINVARYIIV